MSVTYLEPMAEAGIRLEAYELRLDPESAATVGLFSNSFPDAAEFLAELEPVLSKAFPHATFRHYDKGESIHASAPAAEPLIEAIARECQAVITAWGH